MKKIEDKSIYDEVEDFRDGFAAVKRNGKWGFVNEQCEEVVPCKYDDVVEFSDGYFSEGFAKVKLDGKWGKVNKQGEEVIPCKYDDFRDFSEGFAAVELDGKWGKVNTRGEEFWD